MKKIKEAITTAFMDYKKISSNGNLSKLEKILDQASSEEFTAVKKAVEELRQAHALLSAAFIRKESHEVTRALTENRAEKIAAVRKAIVALPTPVVKEQLTTKLAPSQTPIVSPSASVSASAPSGGYSPQSDTLTPQVTIKLRPKKVSPKPTQNPSESLPPTLPDGAPRAKQEFTISELEAQKPLAQAQSSPDKAKTLSSENTSSLGSLSRHTENSNQGEATSVPSTLDDFLRSVADNELNDITSFTPNEVSDPEPTPISQSTPPRSNPISASPVRIAPSPTASNTPRSTGKPEEPDQKEEEFEEVSLVTTLDIEAFYNACVQMQYTKTAIKRESHPSRGVLDGAKKTLLANDKKQLTEYLSSDDNLINLMKDLVIDKQKEFAEYGLDKDDIVLIEKMFERWQNKEGLPWSFDTIGENVACLQQLEKMRDKLHEAYARKHPPARRALSTEPHVSDHDPENVSSSLPAKTEEDHAAKEEAKINAFFDLCEAVLPYQKRVILYRHQHADGPTYRSAIKNAATELTGKLFEVGDADFNSVGVLKEHMRSLIIPQANTYLSSNDLSFDDHGDLSEMFDEWENGFKAEATDARLQKLQEMRQRVLANHREAAKEVEEMGAGTSNDLQPSHQRKGKQLKPRNLFSSLASSLSDLTSSLPLMGSDDEKKSNDHQGEDPISGSFIAEEETDAPVEVEENSSEPKVENEGGRVEEYDSDSEDDDDLLYSSLEAAAAPTAEDGMEALGRLRDAVPNAEEHIGQSLQQEMHNIAESSDRKLTQEETRKVKELTSSLSMLRSQSGKGVDEFWALDEDEYPWTNEPREEGEEETDEQRAEREKKQSAALAKVKRENEKTILGFTAEKAIVKNPRKVFDTVSGELRASNGIQQDLSRIPKDLSLTKEQQALVDSARTVRDSLTRIQENAADALITTIERETKAVRELINNSSAKIDSIREQQGRLQQALKAAEGVNFRSLPRGRDLSTRLGHARQEADAVKDEESIPFSIRRALTSSVSKLTDSVKSLQLSRKKDGHAVDSASIPLDLASYSSSSSTPSQDPSELSLVLPSSTVSTPLVTVTPQSSLVPIPDFVRMHHGAGRDISAASPLDPIVSPASSFAAMSFRIRGTENFVNELQGKLAEARAADAPVEAIEKLVAEGKGIEREIAAAITAAKDAASLSGDPLIENAEIVANSLLAAQDIIEAELAAAYTKETIEKITRGRKGLDALQVCQNEYLPSAQRKINALRTSGIGIALPGKVQAELAIAEQKVQEAIQAVEEFKEKVTLASHRLVGLDKYSIDQEHIRLLKAKGISHDRNPLTLEDFRVVLEVLGEIETNIQKDLALIQGLKGDDQVEAQRVANDLLAYLEKQKHEIQQAQTKVAQALVDAVQEKTAEAEVFVNRLKDPLEAAKNGSNPVGALEELRRALDARNRAITVAREAAAEVQDEDAPDIVAIVNMRGTYLSNADAVQRNIVGARLEVAVRQEIIKAYIFISALEERLKNARNEDEPLGALWELGREFDAQNRAIRDAVVATQPVPANALSPNVAAMRNENLEAMNEANGEIYAAELIIRAEYTAADVKTFLASGPTPAAILVNREKILDNLNQAGKEIEAIRDSDIVPLRSLLSSTERQVNETRDYAEFVFAVITAEQSLTAAKAVLASSEIEVKQTEKAHSILSDLKVQREKLQIAFNSARGILSASDPKDAQKQLSELSQVESVLLKKVAEAENLIKDAEAKIEEAKRIVHSANETVAETEKRLRGELAGDPPIVLSMLAAQKIALEEQSRQLQSAREKLAIRPDVLVAEKGKALQAIGAAEPVVQEKIKEIVGEQKDIPYQVNQGLSRALDGAHQLQVETDALLGQNIPLEIVEQGQKYINLLQQQRRNIERLLVQPANIEIHPDLQSLAQYQLQALTAVEEQLRDRLAKANPQVAEVQIKIEAAHTAADAAQKQVAAVPAAMEAALAIEHRAGLKEADKQTRLLQGKLERLNEMEGELSRIPNGTFGPEERARVQAEVYDAVNVVEAELLAINNARNYILMQRLDQSVVNAHRSLRSVDTFLQKNPTEVQNNVAELLDGVRECLGTLEMALDEAKDNVPAEDHELERLKEAAETAIGDLGTVIGRLEAARDAAPDNRDRWHRLQLENETAFRLHSEAQNKISAARTARQAIEVINEYKGKLEPKREALQSALDDTRNLSSIPGIESDQRNGDFVLRQCDDLLDRLDDEYQDTCEKLAENLTVATNTANDAQTDMLGRIVDAHPQYIIDNVADMIPELEQYNLLLIDALKEASIVPSDIVGDIERIRDNAKNKRAELKAAIKELEEAQKAAVVNQQKINTLLDLVDETDDKMQNAQEAVGKAMAPSDRVRAIEEQQAVLSEHKNKITRARDALNGVSRVDGNIEEADEGIRKLDAILADFRREYQDECDQLATALREKTEEAETARLSGLNAVHNVHPQAIIADVDDEVEKLEFHRASLKKSLEEASVVSADVVGDIEARREAVKAKRDQLKTAIKTLEGAQKAAVMNRQKVNILLSLVGETAGKITAAGDAVREKTSPRDKVSAIEEQLAILTQHKNAIEAARSALINPHVAGVDAEIRLAEQDMLSLQQEILDLNEAKTLLQSEPRPHIALPEEDDVETDSSDTGIWADMLKLFANAAEMKRMSLSYSAGVFGENSAVLYSTETTQQNGVFGKTEVPNFKITFDHDPDTGIVKAKCTGPKNFPDGFSKMLNVYAEAGSTAIKINLTKKRDESDEHKQGREYQAMGLALQRGLVPSRKGESLADSVEFFKKQEQKSSRLSYKDEQDVTKYPQTKGYITAIVESSHSDLLYRLIDSMSLEPEPNSKLTPEQKSEWVAKQKAELKNAERNDELVDRLLAHALTGKLPAKKPEQQQELNVNPHNNLRNPRDPSFLGKSKAHPSGVPPVGRSAISRLPLTPGHRPPK